MTDRLLEADDPVLVFTFPGMDADDAKIIEWKLLQFPAVRMVRFDLRLGLLMVEGRASELLVRRAMLQLGGFGKAIRISGGR